MAKFQNHIRENKNFFKITNTSLNKHRISTGTSFPDTQRTCENANRKKMYETIYFLSETVPTLNCHWHGTFIDTDMCG